MLSPVAPFPLADTLKSKARATRQTGVIVTALVVAALLQSLVIPLDCDVSWLLTASEQVLAGKRLYIDIIEVNPPASVWLYLPMVWLAHMLAVKVEAVVVIVTLLLATASTWGTARLASGLSRPPAPRPLIAVLAFVTMVFPAGLFAQREHFALLFALPALTALSLVADRRRLGLGQALLVGAAAAMVIIIKPHFALVILPAAGWAAWRSRSLSGLLTPAITAFALVTFYALAVLKFADAYLALVPMLGQLYLPMRETPLRLLQSAMLLSPLSLAIVARALAPRAWPTLSVTLLCGSAGFVVAGLIQGKGYFNHALPGIALALVAVIILFGEPSSRPSFRPLLAAATLFMTASLFVQFAALRPPPGLVDAIEQVAPPHPSIITLGTGLATGHPATRLVEGRWVGTYAALTAAAGARSRSGGVTPPAGTDLGRWYAADLATFCTDVARERPDLILVEQANYRWLITDAGIRRAMVHYRRAAVANDIELWVRL
ncbi:hypothetical protein [Sphingomonas sp. RB1R13]|uniref:hypothetical protein n=1 Tax=Sphingomonas sp. RB1R13 TaxID=3096159 RepID=UPI002FC87671